MRMMVGVKDLEGWENIQEGRRLNMEWQRGRSGQINIRFVEELEFCLEEDEEVLKDFRE